MSTAPFEDDRASPAEVAAGFLAAISLTASAIALVYRPVRLAPFALLVAFIAAALAKQRNPKLAAAAVAASNGRLAGGNGHRGHLSSRSELSLPEQRLRRRAGLRPCLAPDGRAHTVPSHRVSDASETEERRARRVCEC